MLGALGVGLSGFTELLGTSKDDVRDPRAIARNIHVLSVSQTAGSADQKAGNSMAKLSNLVWQKSRATPSRPKNTVRLFNCSARHHELDHGPVQIIWNEI